MLAIAAVLILAVGLDPYLARTWGNGEPDQASAKSSDLLTATTTPTPTVVPSIAPHTPGDVLSALNASLEPSGYELGPPAAYDDGDTIYIAGEIVLYRR